MHPVVRLFTQFFGEHLVEIGPAGFGFVSEFVSVVFVAVHRAARDGRRPSPLKMIFSAENPPYVVRRKIQNLLQLPILRSQISAIRSRVRVFSIRYRFGPVPVPEPEDPYLLPDQPRPETRSCSSALKGKLE
jgi:hypothetical protein